MSSSPETDSSGFALGVSLATNNDGAEGAYGSNDSLTGFASATSPNHRPIRNTIEKGNPANELSIIRAYSKAQHVTLRDVVESLARSIAKVARDNDRLAPLTHVMTEFDAARAPDVDLVWYIWRIVNDLNAAKEPVLFRIDGSQADLSVTSGELDNSAMGRGLRCLLLSLLYVDRMTLHSGRWFRLCSRNVHRVMLGTLYTALKYSDDNPGRLSYFAQLGGIPPEQLKAIEVAVCKALQFDFYVTENEFRGTSLAHLHLAVKAAALRKQKQQQQRKASSESA